jgi:peroxiredoxin family protein
MLVEPGAKLHASKITEDMMNLKLDDFVDGLQRIVIAIEFIDMTYGVQIVFI